ncbi:MAG: glycine cleavage system aminomethyltransferase GcvT [Chitinispirillaceae bacterium]|nr:glycine cleavage system aminomethyltransferase GcvT [Chitinispirillaceae bacterium]
MKKTLLYETHVALGARMAPFGGYLMPIQYSGIINEHKAAREKAAIFDTCHMGEFRISGGRAVADLEAVLSCPVAGVKVGSCRYGFICNETGGVIDDQIFYRMDDTEFFMVVNAATTETDFEWIGAHLSSGTQLANLSGETAKIDLQGPESARIMQRLMEHPIGNMKYYSWAKNRYKGDEVLISRTGYTGEIGFEIYTSHDRAKAFWNECIELGALPAGLGARDTLRLEMGYPLYGHELDEHTNAAASGLSRAIDGHKKFIGSDVVLDASQKKRLLCGIQLSGRRAARHGDTVTDTAGNAIGKVTSGSFSPTLSRALALGYIALDFSEAGTPVAIKTQRDELPGEITALPFYKNATGRADLSDFLG